MADAESIQVELKVMIGADQVDLACKLFGLADAPAKRSDVTFYDTPTFELSEAGLILRSRKVNDGGDDATVKMRPLARSAVAANWFELAGFKCEEDRTGSKSVESCSITVKRSGRDIEDVTRGKRPIESLFSERQREFASTYSSVAPDWTRVVVIGPIATKEWKFGLPELQVQLTAEMWTLPGERLLEISTKVPRREADSSADALDAALSSRGLQKSSTATTKTRAALESLLVR